MQIAAFGAGGIRLAKEEEGVLTGGEDQHMIITISGDIGSGKSATSQILSKRLGSRIVSTGALQREIAKSMGISSLELNKLSETDPSIDARIDEAVRRLADSSESLIVDSRLAWHFIPRAIKVYLVASPEVAAERIFRQRRADEAYVDAGAAMRDIAQRKESENSRFFRTYGVRADRPENFDLVIDGTLLTPDEIAERILEFVNSNRSGRD